jgi:hypothetical protein
MRTSFASRTLARSYLARSSSLITPGGPITSPITFYLLTGRVTSVGLLRRNSYGNLGAFLPADGCFYGHPGALPVNVARDTFFVCTRVPEFPGSLLLACTVFNFRVCPRGEIYIPPKYNFHPGAKPARREALGKQGT